MFLSYQYLFLCNQGPLFEIAIYQKYELHWPHCLTKLSDQFAFVASVDVRLVHLGHVDLIFHFSIGIKGPMIRHHIVASSSCADLHSSRHMFGNDALTFSQVHAQSLPLSFLGMYATTSKKMASSKNHFPTLPWA